MTSQNHPQGPYGQEPQGQGQSYPYHSSNYPGVNYRDMNAWRPMPPYHNLGFIAFGLAILGFITCFIPSLVFQLFSGATLISGLVLGIVSIVTRGVRKWPGIAATSIAGGGALVFTLVAILFSQPNSSSSAVSEAGGRVSSAPNGDVSSEPEATYGTNDAGGGLTFAEAKEKFDKQGTRCGVDEKMGWNSQVDKLYFVMPTVESSEDGDPRLVDYREAECVLTGLGVQSDESEVAAERAYKFGAETSVDGDGMTLYFKTHPTDTHWMMVIAMPPKDS